MPNLRKAYSQEVNRFFDSLTPEYRAQLGDDLIEYFKESEHQGFSGVKSHDVTGMYRFLKDFAIYAKNKHENDGLMNPFRSEINQWNAGHRIEAVKGFRAKKGCGLKEAHDFFLNNPECKQ